MMLNQSIQGLRAIAICFVLGFHFFPGIFPGGFVGVDIFFVISGYLITNNITKQKKLSIVTFYVARLKRLMPALIAVLSTTIILGYFLLWPYEFRTLGNEIIFAELFLSNFYYMKKLGYFDSNHFHYKLQMLWSLGIEVQFYLIWPLIIKIYQTYFKFILLLLVLISFCLILIFQEYQENYFYNPICRLWEFGIGGMISTLRAKKIHNINMYIGILLLIISIFCFNKDMLYPSFVTLLPVIGTSLILMSKKNIWSRIFLESSLSKYIGNISYPLYLWHWPVLTFFVLLYPHPLEIYIKFLLIFFSLLLAVLTNKYIERILQS